MSVLITPEVARDIAKIIREHHGAMAAVLFGKDAVSEEDWKLAEALGLIGPEDTPQALTEAMAAYGAMLAHLDQSTAQSRYGMTMADFLTEIRRNPTPQTAVEAHAARHAARKAAASLSVLGTNAARDTTASLIEHDAKLDRDIRLTIRDVIAARFGDDEAAVRVQQQGVAQGLAPDFFEGQFRSTIARQVSDIGHLTDDWERDLERVVQTETTAAIHSGTTESWEEQEAAIARDLDQAPRPIRVFRLPRPDACRYCVELYLEGGVPRVFLLSEIQGNGTNIGKRRAGWQPIEGPTHPFCGCSIHRVPAILDMPKGWRSGAAAPSVIGPGGRIVM